MLSRICYTLKTAWDYRAQLKSYALNPKLQLAKITELGSAALRAQKVQALILDFDGVLASHAEPIPRPEVIEWLKVMLQDFVGTKIYIWTNKPTVERQAYFSQDFPELVFVMAKRKKPYPDGIRQILQHSGLMPEQLLLVDDRLTTGILAAVSCNIQAYWLTKPYISFWTRPLRELWFVYLRWLERVACKII